MSGKGLRILLSLVMIACLLTGCGGFDVHTGNNGGVVSGEAVSGEAVSGEAVSVERKSVPEKKSPYSNDDNFYYVSMDGRFFQYKLDGTKRNMDVPKEVEDEESFPYLCWVDNEWLYYHIETLKGEGAELWRVPIRKQKEGDRVLWQKREKVFEKKNFGINEDYFYVGKDVIIYCGSTDDDPSLMNYYKFDLNTKEETPLWETGTDSDLYECLKTEDYITAAEQGVSVLLDSNHKDKDILYYVDLNKWETKKVYECKSDYGDQKWEALYDGSALLFVPGIRGEEVWRYKEGGGEAHCLLGKDKLEQELEKMNPWEIAGEEYDCLISGIYLYGKRLYLDVAVEWEREEMVDKGPMSGKKTKVSHIGAVTVSCNAEDASDFRYEEGINRCMKRDSLLSCNEWSGVLDYQKIESGFPVALMGNDLYLDFYDAAEKSVGLGCYNMETGEFKTLDAKDKEFWCLLYAGYDDWAGDMLEE